MLKKSNYFIYIASSCLTLWGLLFLSRVFAWQEPFTISKISAQLEIITNFIIIIIALRIYKNMNKSNRNILIWLVLSSISLLIGDTVWYKMMYFNNSVPQHFNLIAIVIDFIPFYIWNMLLIVFLLKILNKYILPIKHFLTIGIGFAIINIIIISLIMLYIKNINTFSIIQMSSLVIQIMVFDFAILCLIYAENLGLKIFLVGFIISIAGNFLCIYANILQTPLTLSYGELFYLLGLLFVSFGLYMLFNNDDDEIKNWVRHNAAIKGKLAFWCFSIGIVSFLLFFIIAYTFSIISREVFVGLPLFIMLYSVIVVLLSLYMGKYFEQPFKQLTNNINTLMLDDNIEKLQDNFSTEEFIFLQNFILKAFKYKEEKEQAKLSEIKAQKELLQLKHDAEILAMKNEANKNKILQEFGVMAAKVAHDISSPLMVANSSISNIEKGNIEAQIPLIKQSLQDIRNISGKILTTYREITDSACEIKLSKVDDGSTPRYVILSSLLEQQVNSKKIEWQDNPCQLELNIAPQAQNIFAYLSPTEFNRSISNLLNNAYDSLSAKNRNISVELSLMDFYVSESDKNSSLPTSNDPDNNKANFILTIKDTGSGIPEDKISQVLAGASTKHTGNGIGLSGAKIYFESIGATLKLKSVINEGTEVIIKLPLAKAPVWFEKHIDYTEDTTITILDDSPTIIMLWQKVLTARDIQANYFMDANDFMDWYATQSNQDKILLFIDYDLGNETLTGLDIINKLKGSKTYLVTNHAEEDWLQEIASNTKLKLLPKKIIGNLEFDLT